jgi:hypothetical protein
MKFRIRKTAEYWACRKVGLFYMVAAIGASILLR